MKIHHDKRPSVYVTLKNAQNKTIDVTCQEHSDFSVLFTIDEQAIVLDNDVWQAMVMLHSSLYLTEGTNE